MNTTKPSSTLRFLERNEVFTLQEFLGSVDHSVSERTRYTNLVNAVHRGQAYRVRRGLYVSNVGAYRDRVPNVFLVAAKAAPDAAVSHHSALELHGVAHTPLRAVYFTSKRRLADFQVRGYRFTRLAPPRSMLHRDVVTGVTKVRSDDALVPVTTRERTLVDCLRDVGAAGGVEELLRSVGGYPSLSTEALREYLRIVDSPTVSARVGWVLELFANQWEVDEGFLDELSRATGRGSYRLVRTNAEQRFVARWRLYVPAGFPYEEWVRG